MSKDRIYINENYRNLIKYMTEKDLLGFNGLENKDIFSLVVAMGMDAPKDVENRDGFLRVSYLKPVDSAIISLLLLSKADTDDEVDEYSDFDKAIDFAEKAAEKGFRVLSEKISEAEDDRKLLERKLLMELDSLYLQNIENDI